MIHVSSECTGSPFSRFPRLSTAGWEGGGEGREGRETNRLCRSDMAMISFSIIPIFSSEEGWGRPIPKKDIFAVFFGGGRGRLYEGFVDCRRDRRCYCW